MWKPKISFENGKFHAETAFDNLILRIFATIFGTLLIYFSLLWEAKDPSSLHITRITIGTMLAIAPPLYWAIAVFAIGMIGVIQQLIRVIKEKREKKSEN